MSATTIVLACLSTNTFAQYTTTSAIDKQSHIALTVYNNNLALIKDTRNISLKAGKNRLIFENISAKIKPETASLNTTNDENPIKLIEQSFNYDLITPKNLLEKHLGRDVKVIRTNPATGVETALNATVLSVTNGIVLQIGNHIETGIPERIQFPDVPDNLRNKPTLIIDLEQQHSASQAFDLNYLSTGLSWKTDYVAQINSTETSLNLNAWVTLTNQSGSSYKNAQIQLVAGNVNQVRSTRYNKQNFERERVSLANISQAKEESLLDFHLYSLPNKTDILNNQSKQIALFSRTEIPAQKTYRISGSTHYYQNRYAEIDRKDNPDININFVNNKTANLDLPLPSGIIRSYKNDSENNLQFVGENKIEHTSKNKSVKLSLGKAFDINTTRKQTYFKIKSKDKARLSTKSEYEITVKNEKNSDITLIIEEPVPGDWEILNETHPHEKINSSTAQWKLPVSANSETVLVYSVKIEH
ncbi:MAG: DUF4139 domain-containing protein [Gammaproteobacteria bacterium]|nr:DUF4139 domain-containing protein [Gammaproteobacteria bacterium]